jgi:DNA-binding CsgD family transcriptional regulator
MLLRAAELARAANDDVALCDALGSLAISYFCQDDPDAMRGPLEETLKVAEAIGYEDDVRWCLWCLAQTALAAGDLDSARAHSERALAMMPGQDQLCRYTAIETLSICDAMTGASEAARDRSQAELEPSRRERVRLSTGVLMHSLGIAALAAGDLDRARQWAGTLYQQESEVCYLAWHAQEILLTAAIALDDSTRAKMHAGNLLAAAEPLGNLRARAIAQLGLARAVLLEGDDQQAESVTHDALRILMDHRWRPATIDALDVLAEIAFFQGQHERAIRLAAAAEAQRTALGLVRFPFTAEKAERQLASAQAALGDEKFKTTFEDGVRLSLQEAVAYTPSRAATAGACVISTRHDLRLGLHQLRVVGDLTEIRAADLRFTQHEARELLAASDIALSAAEVAVLHQRTEGWAAGLRLAALSLAGHPEPRQFVAEFSGSDRTVAEYLLAELLDRQPAEVQRLLLRTSILDRVNGELADLLTSRAGSERILLDLEDANAFVVSLDGERTWFRYHHLFADLLRLQLRRTLPEEVPTLHRRAAEWLKEHGHIADFQDVMHGFSVSSGAPPAPPAEPLSPGELRVLRYLPTNLSRPEIADELSLSVNTIGTHLRRIYAKLGADDRTDAVRRARELRLLSAAR